jgi:predicted TIM-barrel fold metal-dependent hydrolase
MKVQMKLIEERGLFMNTEAASNSMTPTIPGPDPDTRKPKSELPAGSCDCHAHIFGPQSKYPYYGKRRYTPPDALLEDYLKMLRTLGVQRAVLIQPTAYMTDNSRLLDAMRETNFSLRGIAVVDETIADKELEEMHAAGVRGLRVNLLRSKLRFGNDVPTDVIMKSARRIAHYGWHLQFRISPADFVNLEPLLEKLPVDIVIDHIGNVPVSEGVSGESFQVILKLVKTGRCWVKLSGPMRMSKQEFPYQDVFPFVHALVTAAPDQMLWATDWPHTTLPTKMPNDGDLCDLLFEWIPDPAVRKKVLVDNPARLYGF